MEAHFFMRKKQFKTESKRLLDLMINSIYTHKDIFLRELISNSSDALDKLAFRALTDEGVGLNRSDLAIDLSVNEIERTLTISDNGIGMTQEELENNLGTIAKSGTLQFREDMAQGEAEDTPDIIGQFGVGFYSAFMVAETVSVVSRAYGSDEAYRWESSGADGYTIVPAFRATPGTDVTLYLKASTEEDDYDKYLDVFQLEGIVKKYSDYIRYPIRAEITTSREKARDPEAPADAPVEYETVKELTTLNSMVPLWQRKRSDVTDEERNAFYRSAFSDYQDPISCIQTSVEGAVTYRAMLFIPGRLPSDFYARDCRFGLQLYSNNVMIMENCPEMLPEYFRFVKGVVDSPDFSLNISREMLQQTGQVKKICSNLEKKIKAELVRLQKEDFETYLQFWTAFGILLKYGVVNDYGVHKDFLRELLLFPSSTQDFPTSLADYVSRMPEDQPYIYYASGRDVEQIASLPQAERFTAKGYEILCLTNEVDEFVLQVLEKEGEKYFKSIDADDALPETDDEKAENMAKAAEHEAVTSFMKEKLTGRVFDVRLSGKLVSHAVCMTADGPISLDMEKYFKALGQNGPNMTARRVLEVNPDSQVFTVLAAAVKDGDTEKAERITEILYSQALLIAGYPLEDPSAFSDMVCALIQ